MNSMLMNHLISRATAAELPEIVAIYNSTIASRQVTADLEPVSVASRQAWFDAHQHPHRPIYVLKNRDTNEVLAWGSFSDYYPRAAYCHTAEISIYVRHDARGTGYGRDLLAYMLMQAPQLSIKTVIGVIFAHNFASLNLFGKFGFEQWGLLPQVCNLDGHEVDVVLLGKKIIE